MGKNAWRKRQVRRGQAQRSTRVENGDGTTTIKLSPRALEGLSLQNDLFREKFGREPGPEDPIFFDPDADTPVPLTAAKLEAELVKAMQAIGVDPAIIYATQVTGFLVTEDTVDLWSEADLAEWSEAINRYRALHAA